MFHQVSEKFLCLRLLSPPLTTAALLVAVNFITLQPRRCSSSTAPRTRTTSTRGRTTSSASSPGSGGSLCGPDLLLGSGAAYRHLLAALCLLTLAAASITFTLPLAAAGLTPAPPLPTLPSLNMGGQGHLPFWANVAAFVAVDNTKSRICGAEVSRAGTRVFEVYWVLGCD